MYDAKPPNAAPQQGVDATPVKDQFFRRGRAGLLTTSPTVLQEFSVCQLPRDHALAM